MGVPHAVAVPGAAGRRQGDGSERGEGGTGRWGERGEEGGGMIFTRSPKERARMVSCRRRRRRRRRRSETAAIRH